MKRALPPIILDLALVVAVTVLGYVVARWLDLFDGLVAWANANETRAVDALLGALIVVPTALALFAFRRWYDLRRALRERAAAECRRTESARLEGVLLAARTMQHEINNQLGVTVGYAELLSQDPSLSREQREMAQAAMHGAERASALLNRLRSVNRVDLLHIGAPDGPILKLNHQTSGVTSARRG